MLSLLLESDMEPSTRLLYINCNISVNTLRRYQALQLDSRVISLISTWISPIILSEEDYICEACFDVCMQTINAQIHGNSECDPSACSSRRGHAQVCPVCGRSLLNRQSDHILQENASRLTLRMIDLIQTAVAPRQESINTVPAGLTKHNRLRFLHYTFCTILGLLFLRILWAIFSMLVGF